MPAALEPASVKLAVADEDAPERKLLTAEEAEESRELASVTVEARAVEALPPCALVTARREKRGRRRLLAEICIVFVDMCVCVVVV